MNIEGNTVRTTTIEINAPLERSTQSEEIIPIFEYTDEKGVKINESYVGDPVPVVDLSTFEGSKITDYYWTVTKDGEEVYSGKTPYTEYTKEAGTYVTSLRIKNEFGIMSDVYTDTLTVKDYKLLAEFVYTDKDGKSIEKAFVGDNVSIKDNSVVKTSPLKATLWEVRLDGEEIYKGETPYDKYTEKAGTYETKLTLTNDRDVSSECLAVFTVEEKKETPTQAPTTAPTQAPTSAPATTQSGKVVDTGAKNVAAGLLAVLLSSFGLTTVLKKKKHN